MNYVRVRVEIFLSLQFTVYGFIVRQMDFCNAYVIMMVDDTVTEYGKMLSISLFVYLLTLAILLLDRSSSNVLEFSRSSVYLNFS